MLNESNWDEHDRRINSRICRRCRNEYSKDWLKNPERRKNYRLKLVFGITLDDAKRIWERQLRRCWLCTHPLSFKEANVDHDYNSGEVRGLVHGACNAIAGLAKDDSSLLDSISKSLERDELAERWTEASRQ